MHIYNVKSAESIFVQTQESCNSKDKITVTALKL